MRFPHPTTGCHALDPPAYHAIAAVLLHLQGGVLRVQGTEVPNPVCISPVTPSWLAKTYIEAQATTSSHETSGSHSHP